MKNFLLALSALVIAFITPLHAQQTMGAIATPQINSTYYVGSVPGFNSTIQAAVTAACAAGGNRMVDIPAGYTGADLISAATGGCTGAPIEDERAVPNACYAWSGTAYTSAGCGASVLLADTSPQTMAGPLNSPGVTSSITDSGGQAYNVLSAGAQCNGSTDDTTDIQSALTSHGASARIVLPAGKTCVVAGVLSIPGSATLDLNYGTLKFTGSGGGACSAGTNGLIQMFGFSSTVQGPGYINTASSTANCLFNISNSSFATGNTVKLVQSTTATSTHQIGAYVANQASALIDNNEWSQFYPASATIGIIDIPGMVNVGTISANNFQLTGETLGVYPAITVTGQTTALMIGGEKQGNLCETGYCVYVSEPGAGGGNDVNSISISYNYIEDGGTNGPDINLVGGVSGAEISHNYATGGTTGIINGYSGNAYNPLATKIAGNILASQSSGILDYGAASVIQDNTVNGSATSGLTENGSATVFGNIFTSSPVVLNSTGNYVGVNTYYAGSLTCPNGGNIIFDTGITPNANCTGMVASLNSLKVGGYAFLPPQLITQFSVQAGTGAGATAVCASGFSCTTNSGTITLTTGTGTLGNGSQVLLGWTTALSSPVNCTANLQSGTAYAWETTPTSTNFQIAINNALSDSTAYEISYVCH
jgi:hypothetical protein